MERILRILLVSQRPLQAVENSVKLYLIETSCNVFWMNFVVSDPYSKCIHAYCCCFQCSTVSLLLVAWKCFVSRISRRRTQASGSRCQQKYTMFDFKYRNVPYTFLWELCDDLLSYIYYTIDCKGEYQVYSKCVICGGRGYIFEAWQVSNLFFFILLSTWWGIFL